MSKTFSATYSNVTLTNTTYNPVYVTGTITGTASALEGATPTFWTITNSGLISSSGGATTAGIRLDAGGVVTNQAGGTVSGYFAIAVYGGGTVTNAGMLNANGTGVFFYLAGTVLNQGGITAATFGIWLGDGGQITNAAGGVIRGAQYGVLERGGTVINAGTIAAAVGAYAVHFYPGYAERLIVDPGAVFIGTVSGGNTLGSTFVSTLELASGASAGTLSGFGTKYIDFGALTLDAGADWTLAGYNVLNSVPLTVSGTTTLGVTGTLVGDVTLQNGAHLSIAAGATIEGSGVAPAYGYGGTSTVVNAGLIDPAFAGVYQASGGAVTNLAGGIILGTTYGVSANDATVVNYGSIGGGGSGLLLRDGASAFNHSNGTITGGVKGVYGRFDPGTLTNAGTISGGTDAVLLAAGYTGRLVVDPGAVFIGTVSGANTLGATAVSTLELASGATTGTLNSFGSQYVDFAQVTIDVGASWLVNSSDVVTTSYTIIDSGTLTNTGSLGSTITLAAGARLTNASGAIISASSVAVTGAASGQVVNAGTIGGVGGVEVGAGSTVTNAAGALITAGTMNGVEIIGGGSVFNAGSIGNAGSDFSAVYFHGSGALYNAATGTITSTYHALDVFGGSGTVINLGVFASSNTTFSAIALDNGGVVSNAASGTILAAYHGIYIAGGGTVFNAGMIAATGAHTISVGLLDGATNRVIVAPGATFIGKVDGGNTLGATAASTLELASGASAGTLTGLGSHYVNFANVTIDNNAAWILASASLGTGYTIVDSGTLTNSSYLGSSVTVTSNASLSNAASGTIESSGTAVVGSGVTVMNTGDINGDVGVALGDDSRLINQAGGLIIGGSAAVLTSGAPNTTVDNYGHMYSTEYGVLMQSDGGYLTNASGGSIGSAGYGVAVNGGAGTIVNAGSIYSHGGFGVSLMGGSSGVIDNLPGGVITGGIKFMDDSFGTIDDAGNIFGAGGDAVQFARVAGNRLIVHPGAYLSGLVDGGNTIGATATTTLELASGTAAGTLRRLGTNYVRFGDIAIDTSATWTLANATLGAGYTIVDAGTLINAGSLGSPVTLAPGGVLTNASGAIINTKGVVVAGDASVVNRGLLVGSHITFDAGGIVTNAASGTILAATYIDGGGTLFNAGSVAAPGTNTIAIDLLAGSANRVIVAPGASFFGKVDGGNVLGATTVSTLELAPGGLGTFVGLGTQFVDFASIHVDAGASWTLTGDALGAGYSITDSGILTNTGSIGSPVTLGTGAFLDDAAGATIASTSISAVYAPSGGTVLNAGLIAGTTDAVEFGYGAPGLLAVDPGATFTGLVDGGNKIGATTGSAIELLSAATAGTLLGLGTQFINFSAIRVDSGATWTLASAALGSGYVIYDAGKLTNQGSLGSAVTLATNAAFTNAVSAVVTVAGLPAAIYANVGAATVVNAGIINDNATKSDGIKLNRGGGVTNSASGYIGAYYSAVGIYGSAGNITNSGHIVGKGVNSDGVFLGNGGSVVNLPGGVISDSFASKYHAVDVARGGTVINAGEISGVGGAVNFYQGYTNQLVINPGATFVGDVNGGNTLGSSFTSTLELASAGSTGSLTGLGTQFINFQQITLDAGASWEWVDATLVNGNTFIAGPSSHLRSTGMLYNYGAMRLDPSTAVLGGLIGTGSATIETGSTLDVQSTLAAGETVSFAGNGELLLGTPTLVAGQLSHFAVGDTIDLAGVNPTSVSYASGHLNFSGGSILLNLASGGTPHAITDGNGGALVTLCLRAGTRIATVKGEIAIERLATGESLRVRDEGQLPVTWIGHRHVDCTRHPNPYLVWPVRVTRGAFGNGLPHRDLWLSPDHAVYVNDVLIPVKYLINNDTIAQVPVADVTYYHVELPHHDVLLAEGLPVESYLEAGDRANFDNAGASLRLHPDFASRTWEAHGYASLVVSGPKLEAARASLATNLRISHCSTAKKAENSAMTTRNSRTRSASA
jgi:Hint domain